MAGELIFIPIGMEMEEFQRYDLNLCYLINCFPNFPSNLFSISCLFSIKVCKSNLVGFKEGYKHFCRPTGRKNFQNGVHLAISVSTKCFLENAVASQAIHKFGYGCGHELHFDSPFLKEFAKLQGLDLSEDVAEALAWADSGFCCPVDTITSPGKY